MKRHANTLVKYPSHALALLSSWVYKTNDALKHIFDEAGYKFHFFEDIATDSQGFGVVIDNNIVLVFRGTEKIKDWITNLDLRRQPLAGGFHGYVHKGFYDRGGILYTQVKKFLNEHYIKNKMLISMTGHSLGGALCVDIARRLREENYDIFQIHTFGQPRYSNPTAAKYLNTLFEGNYIRWAYNNDIVSQIPSFLTIRNIGSYIGIKVYVPTFRKWSHCGTLKYINRNKRIYDKVWPGQIIIDQILGLFSAWRHLKFGDTVKDHAIHNYIVATRGL